MNLRGEISSQFVHCASSPFLLLDGKLLYPFFMHVGRIITIIVRFLLISSIYHICGGIDQTEPNMNAIFLTYGQIFMWVL